MEESIMNDPCQPNDRRDFLKKSLSGVAALGLLPALLPQNAQAEGAAAPQKKPIISRPLGKTGLKLPIVSMGVMNASNPDLVRSALDAGMIMLDTAHIYQGGRNEEMIGQILKGRPRDSYVIATKIPGDGIDGKTGLFTERSLAGPFLEKFELSLKRLGLDHVDILYLHGIGLPKNVAFEPYLTVLQKLKKEGKVRFLGVSTHKREPLVIAAAVATKVYDVVLTAYNFRQPHWQEVKKAIAAASAAGLGIVAMKTQAGVFWDKERQKPINMKAALKWALRDENVHTSIPGITSFDQLELDMSVMADLTLTKEEEKDLDPSKYTLNGPYCSQCGECSPLCPKRLDIPSLMRAHMYAYGYRNARQAKELIASLDLPATICQDCSSCPVQCQLGFDIRPKILDIARIQDVPDEFLA
jgi:predicted aldo/keto reductase-like oxidoreductase